jgi:hypothetical protein
MKGILTVFHAKQLSVYLVVVLIAISAVAGRAEAMFLPVAPGNQATPVLERAADLAKIQKTLESRELQQRLMDLGLSPEAAQMKVNGLSDGQIHQLAANIDALQAGGRLSTNELILILLLVLLIVILI